jgi:hypothetical protein
MTKSLPATTHKGMIHPNRPVKYSPAQNMMAYVALKFCGINPGHRLNANTTMNNTGQRSFFFTIRSYSPGRR